MTDRRELDTLWQRLEAGDHAAVLAALHAPRGDAAVMLRALALFRGGRDSEALPLLESIVGPDRQNPLARLYIWLTLCRLGRHSDAAAAARHPEFVLLPHRGWLADVMIHFWPQHREVLSGRQDSPAPPPASDPVAALLTRREEIDFEELEAEVGGLPRFDAGAPLRRQARRLAAREQRLAHGLFTSSGARSSLDHFQRVHELRPRNLRAAIEYAFVLLSAAEGQRALAITTPIIEEFFAKDPHGAELFTSGGADLVMVHAWALHEVGFHQDSLRLIGSVHPEGPDDWGGHYLSAINWLALGDEERFRRALNGAFDGFFIDTWELMLRPFVLAVLQHVERQGAQTS